MRTGWKRQLEWMVFFGAGRVAAADGLLLNDNKGTMPSAPGSAWIVADPCTPAGQCFDYIENEHYALDFPIIWDGSYNYHHWVTQPPAAPPATFFMEARFRSNSAGTINNYGNDGIMTADYVGADDWLALHGDAVFNASGDFAVTGLANEVFRLFRFESPDGHNWTWAVDGLTFVTDYDADDGNDNGYIQFGGIGGSTQTPPDLLNRWDFVRCGTIGFGEIVESSDPPDGYVDPRQDRPPFQPTALQGLDKFTVTFDQPNGLYINQVTVESTAPANLWANVQWVTRRDNESDGRTLEIILDKRIPPGHRTRFIISDEAEAAQNGEVGATSVVEYAFLPGDVNQDESVSSLDVLTLVVALNNPRAVNPLPHDINRNDIVSSTDILRLVQLLNGVQTSQAWLGYSLPTWP